MAASFVMHSHLETRETVVVTVGFVDAAGESPVGTLAMTRGEWAEFARGCKVIGWTVEDYREGDDGLTPQERLRKYDAVKGTGRARKGGSDG